MNPPRARRPVLGMLFALGLLLGGARPLRAADAGPVPGAAPGPAWSALRFEASSWLATVRVDLELETQPDAARGGRDEAWLSVFRTRMESKILARKTTEIQARFDPGSGAVAGYTKLLLGPAPDRKIYEFSREGAHRIRIEPGPGEAGDRPEVWSAVRKTFHPFEARSLGCQILSEPSVLVYEISSGALAPSARADGICVFSGKTLFRLQIDSLGSRALEVDYGVGAGPAAPRHRETLSAQCHRIVGRPIAGEDDEDEVHLEFCVDPASKLPVQLTTGMGVLGTLSVHLSQVVGPGAAGPRGPTPPLARDPRPAAEPG